MGNLCVGLTRFPTVMLLCAFSLRSESDSEKLAPQKEEEENWATTNYRK